MAKFECVLPWPPSVNHMYMNRRNGGGRIRTQKARAFEIECKKAIHDYGTGSVGADARYSVAIAVHAPDRRVRDLDNLLKPVLDALQSARVIGDDSQIDFLCIRRCSPTKGGSIVVEAEEIED